MTIYKIILPPAVWWHAIVSNWNKKTNHRNLVHMFSRILSRYYNLSTLWTMWRCHYDKAVGVNLSWKSICLWLQLKLGVNLSWKSICPWLYLFIFSLREQSNVTCVYVDLSFLFFSTQKFCFHPKLYNWTTPYKLIINIALFPSHAFKTKTMSLPMKTGRNY